MRNLISNLRAKEICSKWHGGQWSALYQFASSGVYMVENHLRYLQETESDLHPEYNLRPGTLSKKDTAELNSLQRWFIFKGTENGLSTVWGKHHTYGYRIPYIDGGDSTKVEPLKYPV